MYEPLERPVIVCVVSPLLHSYEYGAVPPVGNAWADPSEKPKQDAFVGLIETVKFEFGPGTVIAVIVGS